jgi:glycosyltransferase involved in cell wall biosynthesis
VGIESMKVVYDSEIFLLQKYGGVSRYFAQVISQFVINKSLEIEAEFAFSRTNNRYLQELNDEGVFNFKNLAMPYLSPTSPKKMLLTYGLFKTLNASFASGSRAGISRGKFFHATYYRPNILESLGYKKLAITVHDFIPEKLGWNSIRNPHLGKRQLLNKADLIFCVSQTSANEISQFYGVRDANFVVVPHGVKTISSVQDKVSNVINPNVIYVGHRSGYKNFGQLAKALNLLWQKGFDIQLNTVGPEFSPAEIKEYFHSNHIKNWCHHTNISDNDLMGLYRKASALVITSKMEGFGLPILEAFSQGTAVIASQIKVFEEVCNDLGVFFEVGNPESLAQAIKDEVSNASNLDQIRKRLAHASNSTWLHSAKKMAYAYKQLA